MALGAGNKCEVVHSQSELFPSDGGALNEQPSSAADRASRSPKRFWRTDAFHQGQVARQASRA
jgi:hypothetical protein